MKDKHFKLLRWAPIAASVILMVMIAVVSLRTVTELKKATSWRELTFQTILEAQTVEDKLIDAQSSVRSYARKGQANLLIEYKNDTNIDLQELTQLVELTHDNPEQQKRLGELAAAVKAVFSNDDKVIGLFARQGAAAALQADEDLENEDATNLAINDLVKFTDEEKKLLVKGDAAEQKDYHHAAHLLIYGSIVVAVLLIVANGVAGREMTRRRRAEAEQRELIGRLQKALAEVKTLSGLIPICGWCKNVRNDTGYWQSVEHYVRAHTDATFSHGICPSCREKFKNEIFNATSSPKDTLLGR
ncbi:MAG TPA: CHASE3 domain-containing protein [bacterium]|nr:CHASE3 domain-containing protein [bacterium]